jgi:hypothetical protein
VTRRWVRAATIFAGYAAVLGWLTWPLAASIATRLPYTHAVAQTDVPYITWALAWQSHALATAPARWADANIYHPAPNALFYGDPGLGALPLFAPVFLATGNPTLAINVVFLGGLALTATALHLVVAAWTGEPVAGVVAAATILTNPNLLRDFLAWAPSYAVLAGFPVLMWLAARPGTGAVGVVGRGVLLAWQAAANMVYVAIAAVGPLALLAAVYLARPAWRRRGVALAASIGVALVLLAPVYVGYGRVLRANAAVGEQSRWKAPEGDVPEFARNFFVTVGGVMRPILLIPWALVTRPRVLHVAWPTGALVALGGLVAWRGRRRAIGPPASAWAHGAFWALVGLALATPVAALPARPVVALPHYVALAWLAPTLQRAIRDPDRIAIASLMGWALLAGAAFAALAAAVPRRGGRAAVVALGAAVVLLLARDGGSAGGGPYPLWEPPGDSPVLAQVRAVGGAVLVLPVGATGTTPLAHARAMYRAIYHWQPLLNGYSSYWPAGFEQRMALAQRVPNRAALTALQRDAGLRLVLVEVRALGLGDRGRWQTLADAGGDATLALVARDDTFVLFRVKDPS